MQNQLASQKNNMKDYIDKIQGMEDELRKTEELFGDSQKQLEKTTQNLNWTIQDRDEHKELVEKHLESEDALYGQATSLLETVEETVSDTNYLHQSLNRNKNLQRENLDASQEFRMKAQEKLDGLGVGLKEQNVLQNKFNTDLVDELGKTKEAPFLFLY